MYVLYDFCKKYEYIDGCDCIKKNCMSIYYNCVLILGKKRTSFLIQPIDYKNKTDFDNILIKVLENDEFTSKTHIQGVLIFNKNNSNYINMILETNSNSDNNDNKKLGLVLSYPCYNDKWTNKFARFYVEDELGKHCLFANWCQDYKIFTSGVIQMKKYLEENFLCKVIIELGA